MNKTIYRLSPKNLEANDWRGSIYHGVVLARANNEDEARKLASSAFEKWVEVERTESTPLPPWDQAGLALCEIVNNSQYFTSGPSEILEPANYRKL